MSVVQAVTDSSHEAADSEFTERSNQSLQNCAQLEHLELAEALNSSRQRDSSVTASWPEDSSLTEELKVLDHAEPAEKGNLPLQASVATAVAAQQSEGLQEGSHAPAVESLGIMERPGSAVATAAGAAASSLFSATQESKLPGTAVPPHSGQSDLRQPAAFQVGPMLPPERPAEQLQQSALDQDLEVAAAEQAAALTSAPDGPAVLHALSLQITGLDLMLPEEDFNEGPLQPQSCWLVYRCPGQGAMVQPSAAPLQDCSLQLQQEQLAGAGCVSMRDKGIPVTGIWHTRCGSKQVAAA